MSESDEGNKTQAVALPMQPPVATVEELPKSAEPGTLCFVKSESESYVFFDGTWSKRKDVPSS